MHNFLIVIILLIFSPFSPLIGEASSQNNVDKSVIKVGGLFALSGYSAVAGTHDLGGLLLASEEINSMGGVGGKSVMIITEDFNSEAKTIASAIIKLVTIEKVSFIIGPNWSEFTDVAAPIAKRFKTPMISSTGYTHRLFTNNPYVFSMQYPPERVITPFVKYINSRNFSNLVIISSANAYYEQLSEALISSLEPGISYSKEIINNDSLDYKSLIMRIKKSGYNTGFVVFMSENGPASTFVKQAKSQGIRGNQLLLGPIVPYDDILRDNVMLNEDIVYFDYVSELGKDFSERYKARFNKEPHLGSALAYDALFLLKQGIEECNATDIKLLTPCLLRGLDDGASGEVRFDKLRRRKLLHTASRVYQMKSGKPKDVTPEVDLSRNN